MSLPVRVLCSLVLLATAAGLGGCAAALRNPVPTEQLSRIASIAGLPGVRAFADEIPKDLVAEVRRRMPSLPRLAQKAQVVNGRPIVEILALSGGGTNGAFGAGVLAGWSARGNRPEFEIVTGVSAGAIIAPFAFLGSKYDQQLKEVWTQYQTNELVLAQILPGLLGGPALADTAPLAALIERYVDRAMLSEIARQYRRGRILLVLTTNLDAQRPVVWNMGEIAASRHPDAPALFRKVILASAAIPGAFPPVHIDVEADGKTYEEMHVDGGTTMQVFVSPLRVPAHAFDRLYSRPPLRRIFVINNGRLDPQYAPVKPQALQIGARAVTTLLLNQGNDDIYRIFRNGQDAGADFNLIAIPPAFTALRSQVFDPAYQVALFDQGYKMGRASNAWLKTPYVVPAAARRR